MATSGKDRTSFEVMKYETYTVLIVAVMLVASQTFLNWILGLSGLWIAIIMYVFVSAWSSRLDFTSEGIVYTQEVKGVSPQYWTRAVADLAVMAVGMMFWSTMAIVHGQKMTTPGANKFIVEITTKNFVFKILFAYIAHISLFSFWRVWVNTFNAFIAMWSGK